MSVIELLTGFALVIGMSLTIGLVGFYQMGINRDHAIGYGSLTLLGSLLLWWIIRSVLVREGFIHPVGTLEDGKNHTCCSRRN